MESIEKNDVDISKLFSWGGEFDVLDTDKKTLSKVFIRLVGDADLNKARIFALRKSAQLRKKLRTKNSDERLAYIPDFLELEKESLVEAVLAYSLKDISADIVKNLNLVLPKEPKSEASLEEQEKYQEEVDNWPTERHKMILSKMKEETDKEKVKLTRLSKKRLEKLYETYVISIICNDEMTSKFLEFCTFLGIYKDEDYKNRMFDSLDEFTNLIPSIKNQLIEYYSSLDIGLSELKK